MKLFSFPLLTFKTVVGWLALKILHTSVFISSWRTTSDTWKKFSARTVGSVHLCKHIFPLDPIGLWNAHQGKTGVQDAYLSLFFMWIVVLSVMVHQLIPSCQRQSQGMEGGICSLCWCVKSFIALNLFSSMFSHCPWTCCF